MDLANKPVYPKSGVYNSEKGIKYEQHGITYREVLILALAGNPEITTQAHKDRNIPDGYGIMRWNAEKIRRQADAIIKEMEK